MPVDSIIPPHLRDATPYTVPKAPPAVKLDANESPWPMSAAFSSRVAQALHHIAYHRYPASNAEAVRKTLVHEYGGKGDEYVFGSGSDELIALAATAFGEPRPGHTKPSLVLPSPTFVMYDKTSRIHGWTTHHVDLELDGSLDMRAMARAIASHKPNLVYYATPNNPTGTAYPDEALAQLIEAFPETLHIIDEAYGAFTGRSRFSWVDRFDNVAVMSTLSKVGLASVRFGWIRCRTALARALNNVRQPFNLNAITQTVVELALTDFRHELNGAVQRICDERARLLRELSQLDNVFVYPTEANFVLIRFQSDEVATRVHEALQISGIGVRKFASPAVLQRCLRVTIGQPGENDAFLSKLKSLIC